LGHGGLASDQAAPQSRDPGYLAQDKRAREDAAAPSGNPALGNAGDSQRVGNHPQIGRLNLTLIVNRYSLNVERWSLPHPLNSRITINVERLTLPESGFGVADGEDRVGQGLEAGALGVVQGQGDMALVAVRQTQAQELFGLVRLLVLPLPVDDLEFVDGLNSDRVVAKVFFPDDTVEEVMSRRDNQQIERALILVAIRDVLVDVERLDRAALDGFPDMLDHEVEGVVP